MDAKTVPTDVVSTADIIAAIESSNNNQAIRFERRVFNAVTNAGGCDICNRIQRIHHCSAETAKMIYSTSFGLYQIMGFNLWGHLGYNDTFISFLLSRDNQESLFQQFLLTKGIAYSPKELLSDNLREKFALVYNGSRKYASLILMQLKRAGI
jgi:hypothetical protein